MYRGIGERNKKLDGDRIDGRGLWFFNNRYDMSMTSWDGFSRYKSLFADFLI